MSQLTSLYMSLTDNDLPIDKAVRDLLSEGYGVPIKGRMEKGVRVITYTIDAKEPVYAYRQEVADVSRLRREQADAVIKLLGSIEKLANIEFRPVAHVDKVDNADIRLFQGRVLLPEAAKIKGGGFTHHSSSGRDVVLNNNEEPQAFAFGEHGYAILTHEVLHALGLSHPGGAGKNPRYTKDSTIMSYNYGKLAINGIGPFDVAALQYLYGKPQNQPLKRVVDTEELLESTVLYSESPITLELNKQRHDREAHGELYLNLASKNFAKQIQGVLNGPVVTGGGSYLDVRLAPGTCVKDVLSGPDSRIEIHAVGNNLPNHLQGGARDDVLTPYGGNDVLTGGKGNDTFVLTPSSGFNNRVTDFTLGEDTLKVSGPNRVEVRRHPGGEGLDVVIKDKTNIEQASLYLMKLTANDIRALDNIVIEHIQDDQATTPKPTPFTPNGKKLLPATPMGKKIRR